MSIVKRVVTTVLFSVLLLVPLIAQAGGVVGVSLDMSFTPATIGAGANSRLRFLFTNISGGNVTNIAVFDALPAAVSLSATANISNNCTNMTVIAPDNGASIDFSGGALPSNASCTVEVNVTSITAGNYTNITGNLSSSAGLSNSSSANLTVTNNLPGFSKNFSPANLSFGSPSTLTFIIDNTLNVNRVGSVDFTDNLPPGVVVASPANTFTDCISPFLNDTTITAIPGSSQIILDANGLNFAQGLEVLPATSICVVSVDVIVNSVGELFNQTNDLLADFVAAGFASDKITVTADTVLFSKDFVDDPVVPGGTVTLKFNVLNTDRIFAVTSMAFTDDLTTMVPVLPGLQFSNLISNSCGGSVTGTGTSGISLTGGVLSAEGSCSIEVELSVLSNAIPGVYLNVSGSLTGDLNGSAFVSSPAVAKLFVQPVPIFTKTYLTNPVGAGSDVTLEFAITNVSPLFPALDINFTDILTNTFPFPVSAVLPTNPCGMGSSIVLSVPATDVHRLDFTGGNLAPAGMAGDSCTFSVTITIPDDEPSGTYTNVTSPIKATVDGIEYSGNSAVDDLTIVAAPRLTKEFIDDPVQSGGTVTMQFTLTHDELATTDASNITFSDDLSVALPGLAAIGLPLNNICGTGSSISGTTNLTFTGGTLVAGASCSFNVTLAVPAAALSGLYTNTTSIVTADISGLSVNSNPASDVLNIANISFTKEYIDDPVIPGSNATLRFTIDNSLNTQDVTSLLFVDNLNTSLAGLAVNGPLPATPCGAGSTIIGTTTLTITGGNLLAGNSCSFDVTVLVPAATASGNYTNTTSTLNATVAGNNLILPPAADILQVSSELILLTKSFTDDPVAPGGTVTLEFSIDNLDPANPVTALAFTDDLDAALTGLVALGLPLNNVCGAGSSITGTNLLTFAGGSLAAGGNCTFSVTLQVPAATASSTATNTTSSITGIINSLPVNGTAASDDLSIRLLSFSKSFSGPSTATGTVMLNYTITNQDAALAVNGLAFTDDLDAVISGLVATGLPLNDSCGIGSVVAGTSLITFSGGTIPASGNCSFGINLSIPASAMAGSFPSTSSALFESGLNVANPATANLLIEPAPTFAKTFAPNSIGLNLTSILTFDIDNTASTLAASALTFTDNLPAGLVLDAAPIVANTCAGTLTAVAGSAVVSLSGGSVVAGSGCTIQVRVVATTAGVHVNTTGDLTSSAGNSGTATATLTVNPQPLFAKSFSSTPIVLGGNSTLVFSIDNTASTVAATNLNFTDNLPANMQVANPANASTTCTGGTITAVPASATVSYVSASVAAASSCTLSVDVTTTTSGAFVNISGALSSSLGNSGTATDTLTVNPPPAFSKLFNPNVIRPGDISQLSFSIDNSTSTVAATALDFSDMFPAGLVVATPANSSNTCTGGVYTAAPGSNAVSYTGGSVNASSTCQLTVDVTSSTLGTASNLSGNLTSNLGNSGSAADDLLVTNTPILSKAFANNPHVLNVANTLTFSIDNSGNAVAVSALGFSDTMPAGFEVAATPNITDSCTGGTVTAAVASNVITYAGGTVNANAVCAISVDVIATATGAFTNVTSVMTTSIGDANSATAPIVINPAPLFSKVFAPAIIGSGGVSSLTFNIDNSASTAAASNFAFVDNLPADVTIAAAPNITNSCDAATSIVTNGTSVTVTNGSVPASSSCQISVDVTSSTIGIHTNTTGDLTSDLGNSGTATADINVLAGISFTKSYATAVAPGADVTLSFNLVNNTNTDANNISFTDDLDAVVLTNAINLPINNACGAGSQMLDLGAGVIQLTGGVLAVGASCQIDVIVHIDATVVAGTYTNTTSDLTADFNAISITTAPASADFTVVSLLLLEKSFVGGSITAGDTVELSFTITNYASIDATAITFSDDLNAFIPGATAQNLPQSNVCGVGSSLTGNSTVLLTGGIVPAASSCQFSVLVNVPIDIAGGQYTNVTSAIDADYNGTTIMGDANSSATANLTVNVFPILIPLLDHWALIALLVTMMLLMVGVFKFRFNYK
jgi:hypothetical protein